MNETRKPRHIFDVSADEMQLLLKPRPNPAGRTKFLLWMVTVFLTPVTLIGSLLGYVRGYMRFMHPRDEYPEFYPLRPVVRV